MYADPTHMVCISVGDKNKRLWDAYQKRIDALNLCIGMFLPYGPDAPVESALHHELQKYKEEQKRIVIDALNKED